jgi:predicted PurR-regulated permease PerM
MDERESKKIAALLGREEGSFDRIHVLVVLTVTVFGIYLCYLMTVPFLAEVAWALALGVLFAPMYRWFKSKVKRPNLAATICVLVVVFVALPPVWFLAERIVAEAVRGATTLRASLSSGTWHQTLEANPSTAPFVRMIEQNFDLPTILQAAASRLTDIARSIVRGSILATVGLFFLFYFFYYFLRDGDLALESLRTLSPISKSDMNRLFKAVYDTVHATIYGTFAVAAVQGALGGLMFWWLGLPEPLLWGVAMALLSVVPVLGAFIVWIPAAIFLALEGSEGKALLLTVWGVLVVGGIDNLLFPILVGRQLKMHSVVTFVSIVGGLMLLGPAGLILGPVIFTITRVLAEIWRRRNAVVDT